MALLVFVTRPLGPQKWRPPNPFPAPPRPVTNTRLYHFEKYVARCQHGAWWLLILDGHNSRCTRGLFSFVIIGRLFSFVFPLIAHIFFSHWMLSFFRHINTIMQKELILLVIPAARNVTRYSFLLQSIESGASFSPSTSPPLHSTSTFTRLASGTPHRVKNAHPVRSWKSPPSPQAIRSWPEPSPEPVPLA